MAKSSSFYAGRIAKIAAAIVALQAEQVQAQAREVLDVGATYHIQVGKGETADVVPAVLIGQRTNDKGVNELRFQTGEGFDARFHDVKIGRVVFPESEDGADKPRSSAKIAAILDKLAADKEVAEANLVEAEARETLEDGKQYNIQIGRGETRRVVPAVLLGQNVAVVEKHDEEGNVISSRNVKQLKFFYGAGFDAEVVIVGPAAVVVEDTEEGDAPVDTTTDAGIEE